MLKENLLKQIVVKDKWNNIYIYDHVFKYKAKKGKFHIYSKAYGEQSYFLFNLIYVAMVSVRDQ